MSTTISTQNDTFGYAKELTNKEPENEIHVETVFLQIKNQFNQNIIILSGRKSLDIHNLLTEIVQATVRRLNR